MAMLAEPKRKLKYSVDPRGLAWSTDNSKIGQKLIEKMGWSSGKGLGKHEDGRVEHVKVQQRFSNRGLGCTRQMADHWTAHGDDFASLLENLNAEHSGTSTPQEEEPQQPAVMSLEEKSKSCRSRVHYHRFTRGKDLSACNETDLKSIFGAKKVDRSEKHNASPSTTNSTAETGEGQPEVTFGVPIIMSTSTMAEYFAQKMAARKLNSAAAADVTTTVAVTNNDSSVAVEETAVAAADEEQETDASSSKKKKKSKKSRHAEEDKDNIGSIEENGHSNLDAVVATVDSDAIEIADESSAKKKSKKKRRSEKTQVAEETEDVVQEECEEPVAELPSKKRRKVQQDDSEQSDSVDTSKKKSKCKTVASDVNENNADDTDSNDNNNTTSKELGFTGSNLGKIKGYGSKKAKH